MRFVQSDPVEQIAIGVRELLRRLQTTEVEPAVFWAMHGRRKLQYFLSDAPQLVTPTDAESEAARWLEREVAAVLASIERRPPGSERPEDPDCLRSLVFSNVLTHAGERGVDRVADWRSHYIGVLSAFGLSPRLDDRVAQPAHEYRDPVPFGTPDPHPDNDIPADNLHRRFGVDVLDPPERVGQALETISVDGKTEQDRNPQDNTSRHAAQ